MKIYTAHRMLNRLAGHLILFEKPFTFNGYSIEFTASEEFMHRMYELDPMLKRIEFEIH